jgi:hypothetical protein
MILPDQMYFERFAEWVFSPSLSVVHMNPELTSYIVSQNIFLVICIGSVFLSESYPNKNMSDDVI